jgi:sorbin and SH3 domain containing protein 1
LFYIFYLLLKGELVTITRKIDDNWYEGKIGEQKGIFPVAYVEVLMMDEPFHAKKSNALITCQQSFFVDEFLEPQKLLKERKNIKKTEILHVDTNNEPIV